MAQQRESTGLRWVFGGAAVVSLVVGVAGYKRYADSEAWVAAGVRTAEERGPQLDHEGCIDATIEWHDACDINGANSAVCLQGVKIVMFHCLRGRDRADTCEEFGQGSVTSSKWIYEMCHDRGNDCVNKRECACAESYRAVDSFCRTGGEAVQM